MGGSRKKPFFRENWVFKFGSSRCLNFTTCKMVVCLEKLLELFASLLAPCTIFFSFVVFSLQDLFVKFYRGVQSVLNVSVVLCYVPGGGDLLKDIWKNCWNKRIKAYKFGLWKGGLGGAVAPSSSTLRTRPPLIIPPPPTPPPPHPRLRLRPYWFSPSDSAPSAFTPVTRPIGLPHSCEMVLVKKLELETTEMNLKTNNHKVHTPALIYKWKGSKNAHDM